MNGLLTPACSLIFGREDILYVLELQTDRCEQNRKQRRLGLTS